MPAPMIEIQCRWFGLLGLVVGLVVSSSSAHAHHVGDAGPVDGRGAGVGFIAAPMVEIAPSAEGGYEISPLQVLIGVTYRGYDPEAGTHGEHPSELTRYFWVSGSVIAANLEEGSKFGDTFNLTVVPVTQYRFWDDSSRTVRFLPTEIKRDVEMGMNSSVTVSAVGFSYTVQTHRTDGTEPVDHQNPGNGEPIDPPGSVTPGAGGLPKGLNLFARIAVDALGVRYMNLESLGGSSVGFQPVVVSGAVGGPWDINKTVSLMLSLGVRAAATLAGGASGGKTAILTEEEAFLRIEALLNVFHARMGAFVEGGLHGDSSHFVSGDGENGFDGHGYLMFGVRTQF